MTEETEIQQFYNNKNIFLTGGTGFLGKVFIEKVLRSTNVNYIYILIRQKNGIEMQKRINDMFEDTFFDKLKQLKPDAAKHIRIIAGDCVLPEMGISQKDRQTLIENVEIVVHSAATVRFNEPLYTALTINVFATRYLLSLAKEMKNLKAFIHVSSAFANCLDTHIEERSYVHKLSVSADKLCQISDIVGAEMLNNMSKEFVRDFPNTYTFTKALAEDLVLSEGATLPICIFRPGIIIPTYKEPLPGWVDNLYGPMSIIYGVASGVLRVMYIKMKSIANIVPVDYCANLMLASAWKTAKKCEKINEETSTSSSATIYNLVPADSNTIKWSFFQTILEREGHKVPLTKMIWLPFLLSSQYKFVYNLLCFFYHTIPGYLFDLGLLIVGKKPGMTKMYNKIHKNTGMLNYFVENFFTFDTSNTNELWRSLTPNDQRLYTFNMVDLNWNEYFYHSVHGMRRFLAKEEPETIPKGKRVRTRFLILHRFVQLLVYGGSSALLYWNISKILQYI